MLGSHLVQYFKDSYKVIAVDRTLDKIKKFSNQVTLLENNLEEIEKWENHLDGVEYVVHLAAIVRSKADRDVFMRVNVKATEKLLRACKRYDVQRFLFFSTNDVYKDKKDTIFEEDLIMPKSKYSESKFLAEETLLSLLKEINVKVCIFRAASIYGTNDKGSMKSMINLCKKGIVPMIGNGGNPKALLYIEDCAYAVDRYFKSENPFNGEIFNISSGDYSYSEILDTICKVYGLKPFRLYIPRWLCNSKLFSFGVLKKLKTASSIKRISCKKAIRLLGYRSRYTLSDGLRDSKKYYI